MSLVSHLTIQASGKVVEVDELKKDKAYVILHIYITMITKQIILILQEDSKRKKEDFFVCLSMSHSNENRPFTNLQIFNINSKQEYYKLRFLGYYNCPKNLRYLNSFRCQVADLSPPSVQHFNRGHGYVIKNF